MGCDIHSYIEVVRTQRNDTYYTKVFFTPNITRDYLLFACMAGVRTHSTENLPAFATPKGLPDRLSCEVQQEYYMYVANDEKEEEEFEQDGVSACSKEDAEKYKQRGLKEIKIGDMTFIEDPDYHSASWLTIEELEEVDRLYCSSTVEDDNWIWDRTKENEQAGLSGDELFEQYRKNCQNVPHIPALNRELKAIIAAMKALRDKNHEPRLTFWFDN
jgi:hypothetical protein